MNSSQFSKCTHCQSEVTIDDAFCPNCGSSIRDSAQSSASALQDTANDSCTHCGNALTNDDAFCSECGQPAFTSETVPEPAVAEPEPAVAEPEPAVAEPEPAVAEKLTATPPTPTSTQAKIKVFRCPDCNAPLVPASLSCFKCGKKFSKPIPKIVDAPAPVPKAVASTQPQAKIQNPVLEGTEYHCPKCQMLLATGANQCSGCGVPFAYPVPAYKMSYQEAERLKREEQAMRQREEASQRAAEKERKTQEAKQKDEAFERMKASAKARSEQEAAQATYLKAKAQESTNDAKSSHQARQTDSEQKTPRRKAGAIIIFLAIVFVGGPIVLGGIAVIIDSFQPHTNFSHSTPQPYSSPTNLPTQSAGAAAALIAQGQSYYEQGRYTDAINSYQAALGTSPPPDVDADLRRRIGINQQLLAQEQQATVNAPNPVTIVQNANDQFDAENEPYMESLANQNGIDVNTIKVIAHAILKGYVNDSPVQDDSKRESDFQYTQNGLAVIAKCEAKQPGGGAMQCALDAAQGKDPNAVRAESKSIQVSMLDFKHMLDQDSHMDDGSGQEFARVIEGILNSR